MRVKLKVITSDTGYFEIEREINPRFDIESELNRIWIKGILYVNTFYSPNDIKRIEVIDESIRF